MIKFYDFLLTVLGPFIRWWGKLHFPFTHKKITGQDYYNWRDEIAVGTVLLTKTNGEFSNLINPIPLKHAGIYVGRVKEDNICYVAEAVGQGVVLTDLVTFLTTKDVVVLCHPKFIRNTEDFNAKLQTSVLKFVGLPYDYLFQKSGKAFYCFELAAACLKNVYSELQLNCKEIIKGKRIFDANTFLDTNFFEVTIDSRTDK